MNLEKIAEIVYNRAFHDEMQKLASGGAPTEPEGSSMGPAILALAALPMLANKGSVMGRRAGLAAAPVADALFHRANPNMGLPDFARKAIGARSALPNVGTMGGALAGVAGSALLYQLLSDRW